MLLLRLGHISSRTMNDVNALRALHLKEHVMRMLSSRFAGFTEVKVSALSTLVSHSRNVSSSTGIADNSSVNCLRLRLRLRLAREQWVAARIHTSKKLGQKRHSALTSHELRDHVHQGAWFELAGCSLDKSFDDWFGLSSFNGLFDCCK